MAKPKIANKLIAALIDALPAYGTEWPIDRQKAWLEMMAKALSIAYGGDVAASLASPAPAATEAQPAAPIPSGPRQKFQRAQTYPFYIDGDGYARRQNGDRVVAADVGGDILYDLRGMDGDAATIIWADDSSGLNGCDVTISAVA